MYFPAKDHARRTFGPFAIVQAFFGGEAASSGPALRFPLFRVLSERAAKTLLAPA